MPPDKSPPRTAAPNRRPFGRAAGLRAMRGIKSVFGGERRPSRDMRPRAQTLRRKNLQHWEAFCRSK
jgi:hypothetical protein